MLAKLPAGTSFLLVSLGAVEVYPRRLLLFVSDPPAAAGQPGNAFDSADVLELREQQYDRALVALNALVNDPATRAEALLRIARIYRKSESLGLQAAFAGIQAPPQRRARGKGWPSRSRRGP